MWLAEETIYVSRSSGNDSTTCGTVSSPCRTISYAIHQVSEYSYIYLDGTGTTKDPYTCERPLNPEEYSGINLTKSVSFVGIKSRAYISCLHVNQWLVDGTKHNDGLRVSFCGLAFQNTSLRFLDAVVSINDSLFTDSKHVTMNFTVFNLALFELNLNNVVFQRNTLCISVKSNNRINILVRLTNSIFSRNGDYDDSISIPSILWLSSEKSNINIQLRNCSFKKNKFNKNGMIFVENRQGSTSLSVDQFKMEENGHSSMISRIPNGILFLRSAEVVMSLASGFVYKTYGTFVTVIGQSSRINVSSTDVDELFNPDVGGGVVNIDESAEAVLSIKNSSFRNGKNIWLGGVVVRAPRVKLIIHNSTMHNFSSTSCGGAVFVQSYDLLKTSNRIKDFVAELNIINSSFTDNVSRRGGAVCALVENVIANVTDSLFVRNSAEIDGGALIFWIYDTAAICLRNVHFIENTAASGGIVDARAKRKDSTFNFTTNNVWFVKNKLNARHFYFGTFYLWIERNTSNLALKHTRFIENIGERGTTIYLFLRNRLATFHSVTLDTCIFEKNSAYFGALLVFGQATLICRHSIFDSNAHSPCRVPALTVALNDSTITIANSTFVNNSCGAVLIRMRRSSYFTTENSKFIRNRRIGGSAAAVSIIITTDKNDVSQSHRRSRFLNHKNVLIKNVLFEENIASIGGVLTVLNAKMELLNCTFLNNFALFQGGQIASYGSTDMQISHSVFKETVETTLLSNGTEFTASGFLRIYSNGELLLRNTTATSKKISDEPLILVSKATRVKLDNSSVTTCPLGSNVIKSIYYYKDSNNRVVTVLDLSCRECGYNFYSLQRGHAKGLEVNDSFRCIPCPRGADCLPAIKAKSNFWGYTTSLNPPELAFTICPFGYCKSPPPNNSEYNDCEGQRTGVMCGMCSVGCTEALWSTYCTPIDDCNDHWFWVVFVALVVSMAILLVFKPPFITHSLKQILWLKRFIFRDAASRQSRDYHDLIRSFSSYEESTQDNRPLSSTEQLKHEKRQMSRFLEIIFYFYQIAQLLLSSYSLSEFFDTKFLPPILSFFNFEPSFNKQGFLCPFPGLTPKTKLLFKIVPVFGTMIAIFMIYFFSLIISKLRGTMRHPLSSYLQASIKTIFLGYVTLAIVSISLIRCVSVAGKTRWFYKGNVVCYQWWQYVSFVFTGFFAFPFIFVVAWASFKIQHDTITMRQFLLAIVFPVPCLVLWLIRSICTSGTVNVEETQNLNTLVLKEMLLGPYKKPGENGSKYGALYWQSVLIARRFVLVLIYCVVTEPSVRLFCMTLVCVLVLCCHLIVKPFRNSFANNLESLSLLFLVVLGLINIFKSVFVGFEGNIKGSLVTVFKVFQWMEIVILGSFPSVLSLLVCVSIFSLIIRILVVSCKYLFQRLVRRLAERWNSHQQSRLLNICDVRDSDPTME